MASRLLRSILVALVVSGLIPRIGHAQEPPAVQAPYPGVVGDSYAGGAPYPYVFLGGSRGSHHLNGDTGHGHYVYRFPYGGYTVWSYDLRKYYEDHDYVYYYEYDAKQEWRYYCWAFGKYPYCNNIPVYRRFPGDHHWAFVHGAWRTIVPPNAYGAAR
jgi:hypothetical protein